jgi:hypothetical protein
MNTSPHHNNHDAVVADVGPALAPVALLEAVECKQASTCQPGSLPCVILAGAKGNVLALRAAT